MTASAPRIGDNLRVVREAIATAARKSGRDAAAITLVGASKRQPADRLAAAWEAGLRVFGENRVQEAEEKRPQIADGPEWHLIGPLQSNKARRAAEIFDLIQSVDRYKLARTLDRHARELGRRLPVFLEINLGREDSKHGFTPAAARESVDALAELSGLDVRGVMAIPPREHDPGETRRWFCRLRELRDELRRRGAFADREGALSMGMSADYAIAVEEGATHVRVGTALFGGRI